MSPPQLPIQKWGDAASYDGLLKKLGSWENQSEQPVDIIWIKKNSTKVIQLGNRLCMNKKEARATKMNSTKNIIVLGIVSPAGARRSEFLEKFSKHFENNANYKVETIKLNKLLSSNHQFNNRIDEIKLKINEANDLRKNTSNDVFAYYAIHKLLNNLKRNKSNNIVFIIDQLKREEELSLLRSVLGKSFIVLGITSTRENRIKALVGDQSKLIEEAKNLIWIDENEGSFYESFSNLSDVSISQIAKDHGQQIAKLILKTDVLVNDEFQENVAVKLLQLFLEHPFIVPTRDEYFLNLAFTVSLKSLDLSRQVGSVIVDDCDNIISTGFNEVNKAGGGPYWGDDITDANDYILGRDPNKFVIEEMKEDIVNELNKKFSKIKKADIQKILNSSPIEDITEFHRATHAEMNAILSAQRMNKSVKGATLFCTTFPCHNCAKHLVSAGIKRVVYLEPYDKSLATKLHPDSISESKDGGKVIFDVFYGVTHSRFKDFFSYIKRKEKGTNQNVEFKFLNTRPRFSFGLPTNIEMLKIINKKISKGGKFDLEKFKSFIQEEQNILLKKSDEKVVKVKKLAEEGIKKEAGKKVVKKSS